MSMIRTAVVALGLVACQGPEIGFQDLVPILAVAPSTLEFGEVGIPLSATGSVYVSNAGSADLEVDVTLESDSDVFVLEGGPTLHLDIDRGEEAPLNVTFTPGTYRGYEARLVLTSNDEEHPTETVTIRGTGADLPMPDIEITPDSTIEAVDVAPGTAPILTFEIFNAGDADLVLTNVSLAGDPEFVPSGLPTPGTVVFPGTSTAVAVRYTPTDSSGDDAIVTVTSNDPLDPEVQVLLIGNGGDEIPRPTAVIDCPGTVLLTGPEWVNVDGSGSTDPGGGELTYEWSWLVRPPGADVDVPIDPDDTAAVELYVDVAGLYTVQLVVKNEFDTESEPVFCFFDAIPEDDIHVELTWDTPSADVDLHVAQDGAALFDVPGDCNWCNESPNWGSAGNEDDPRFDIDDLGGWGPENINVLVPAAGTYTVRVHVFDDNGDPALVATVRVWAGGTEIAVEQRAMVDDEVWEVGTVDWPSGTFTVNPAPNVEATTQRCP